MPRKSDKAELILEYVNQFVTENGYAPSVREIGAAVGLFCIARILGKRVQIVMDTENNAAEKLIEEIQSVPEYEGVIISGQDALLRCDRNSILIVVDTNRPDQVECRSLLEAISKVYQQYWQLPDGLLLTQVLEDSNAHLCGLEEGDILLALDGVPIKSRSDLYTTLYNHHIGDTVIAVINRDDKTFTVKLTVEDNAQQ